MRGIVEAVDQEEIDPVVSPVTRGGKRRAHTPLLAVDDHGLCACLPGSGLSIGNGLQDDRFKNMGRHSDVLPPYSALIPWGPRSMGQPIVSLRRQDYVSLCVIMQLDARGRPVTHLVQALHAPRGRADLLPPAKGR